LVEQIDVRIEFALSGLTAQNDLLLFLLFLICENKSINRCKSYVYRCLSSSIIQRGRIILEQRRNASTRARKGVVIYTPTAHIF